MTLSWLLITSVFYAQSSGTITGLVTDQDFNNEPLAFANVLVEEAQTGVITDIDGKFTIEGLASGHYTLTISFVGYETQTIPNVAVEAGKSVNLQTSLQMSMADLEEVVIKTTTRRNSEVALLMDRKKAVGIQQTIGSDELSKKGVGDVSTAVTKTAGVTKQESSNTIYVRGLGDRYNSTSINGLPVPSNNPEKKNIELDIFTTDIVEYIAIDKVYGNHMLGDFAGGNVNIVSKNTVGPGFITAQVGSSLNSNAFAQPDFILQPGSDFWGFKKSPMPTTLESFAFQNSMDPQSQTPIANSFSLSGGKSWEVGSTGKLRFFLTGNYSNDYSFVSGFTKSVNAQGYARKDFEDYKKYSFSTITTWMTNWTYQFNPKHSLAYHFIFINSSDQSLEDYQGYIEDVAPQAYLRRSTFVKNTLMVHQLLGTNQLTNQLDLQWGLAYNQVSGVMPDRIQNTLNQRTDGDYYFATNSLGDNHRYFQELKETDLTAQVQLHYRWGSSENQDYRSKLTLGYSGLIKNRDFEATQFNFHIKQNQAVSINQLDRYFNQQNLENDYFSISTFRGTAQVANALDPQVYTGEQNIHAGFLTYEYHINPKWLLLAGIRAERLSQEVQWETQLDPIGDSDEFVENQWLPNLQLRYAASDKTNFRAGFSKTYTLPQFKERALFIYEDVTEVKVGNPDLYPSQNYNFDLVWEFFPKSDELISLSAFGKYILDPINEVTIASASNDISFVNTGDWGYVAGAELEIRKNIFSLGESARKLSGGLNLSYMKTNQELNADKIGSETRYNVLFNKQEDAFSGASDWLLNADLTYVHPWNNQQGHLMATLAYSHFSDRIYAIGTNGSGNRMEVGRGNLDLILKSKINSHLSLGFKVGNILNPKIERVQQNPDADHTLWSFRKGRLFNLNLNYQF